MALPIVMLSVLAALAQLASSQTATYQTGSTASLQVQTTITGLASTSLKGVAASVVSVDDVACRTTLAMQCTDDNICANALGLQMTVTQGYSYYQVAYSTNTFGGGFPASQNCSLVPSESCVPTATFTYSGGGWGVDCSTSTIAITMRCAIEATVTVQGRSISSKDVTRVDKWEHAQIPITAGGGKLPPSGMICTPPSIGTKDLVAMQGVLAPVIIVILAYTLGLTL
ncbi:unnamed protein product [Cercospora beticola]|nr:unnamed protein product [Cercospora beticola]